MKDRSELIFGASEVVWNLAGIATVLFCIAVDIAPRYSTSAVFYAVLSGAICFGASAWMAQRNSGATPKRVALVVIGTSLPFCAAVAGIMAISASPVAVIWTLVAAWFVMAFAGRLSSRTRLPYILPHQPGVSQRSLLGIEPANQQASINPSEVEAKNSREISAQTKQKALLWVHANQQILSVLASYLGGVSPLTVTQQTSLSAGTQAFIEKRRAVTTICLILCVSCALGLVLTEFFIWNSAFTWLKQANEHSSGGTGAGRIVFSLMIGVAIPFLWVIRQLRATASISPRVTRECVFDIADTLSSGGKPLKMNVVISALGGMPIVDARGPEDRIFFYLLEFDRRRVFQAADTIAAQGKDVTEEAINQRLGSAQCSKVHSHLMDWKKQRDRSS